MLTPEQRAEFDERGFVRLPGAFSREEAAAMEDRLWSFLGRKHGVVREDPSSWEIPIGAGLQLLKKHAVFDPIGGPTLLGALDDLIGEGRWEQPKHWGQMLVSFPVRGGRPRSAGWHTDFPYFLPPDRLVGALVFSFVGEVPPRCGGTLVVAGSHRVVARFIAERPRFRKAKMKVTRQALMASDPWLTALHADCDQDGWEERVSAEGQRIGDVPVRMVELTGAPGDVVIGHPWLLHSGSPNSGDRPRFMRVQRIRPPGA